LKHLLLRFGVLLLMVFLPIAAAYSIGRNLGSQAILYISFLCLLFIPYAIINHLLFRKIYWFILCIFTFAWSLVESGHYVQEHAPFNELALKILYESYLQELIEYTRTTIPLWAIMIAIIAIVTVIIFIFRTKHRLYSFQKNQKIVLFASLFCGASYYLFFANAKGDKAGFLKDEYLGNQILNQYYQDIEMNAQQVAQKLKPFQFHQINQGQKHTYVLIIGESSSRHHFGSYGYFRNTTPLLSQRKGIKQFTDVISSNTSTVECLSRCLTMPNAQTNVHDFSCVNILDVANACGFKTYWISNQAKEGILHNSITSAVSRASSSYFAITQHDKNNVPTNLRFDNALLPQLQNALADSNANKLIVLHLMGSHFRYKNRYPAQANLFTTDAQLMQQFPFADNAEKQQIINEYDNAIAYQDKMLDSMFHLVSLQQNAQAIYFSDHGEELFDYRNFLGHTPQGGNPWLHDVPFVTYQVPDSLLINQAKPYQLNRLFYTLCTWMNIDGNNLPWQESLFRKELMNKPRTLSNGKPYVPIVKQ
jgi:heptose-I-phosphate ethanolaminephosphotransferase